MAKKPSRPLECDPVGGAAMLRRVFPMLARLSRSGCERDRAGNRQLLFSQYAGLILVGLFNPVLISARALVAASGLKKVRRLTGGRKVSLGSFSEAASVFDPRLLEGLVRELRQDWHRQRHRVNLRTQGPPGEIPDRLLGRLIAVDGSVLTALPQLVGRLVNPKKGQWRWHCQVRVCDQTLADSELTCEAAANGQAERDVLTRMIVAAKSDKESGDESGDQTGQLFLMDRGYRSAALFNTIRREGHDYVCRLNRKDGRLLSKPGLNAQDGLDEQGEVIGLPPLSAAAQDMGIVADELITLGGNSGASKIGSDHPIRRITLVPPEDRASSARQSRPRSDQSGRDELILATTLLDLPAERIVALYEHRWQVELFFRFLKQVLKCDTLLSAKTAGVEIQLYCAVIASLLLALATGGNLTRRHFEMISLYFSGWAEEDELLESLSKPPP